MNRTLTLIFLIFVSFTLTAGGDKYVPVEHSDKWYNGKEWSIVTKDSITVKLIVEKVKNSKVVMRVHVENRSGKDVNIDPAQFFYVPMNLDTSAIYYDEEGLNAEYHLGQQLQAKSKKKYCMDSDKIVKNTKLISSVGGVLDINSALVQRGFTKADYLSNTLLYKHTIEPQVKYERIAIFEAVNEARELEFHLQIAGEDFVFRFEQVQT